MILKTTHDHMDLLTFDIPFGSRRTSAKMTSPAIPDISVIVRVLSSVAVYGGVPCLIKSLR